MNNSERKLFEDVSSLLATDDGQEERELDVPEKYFPDELIRLTRPIELHLTLSRKNDRIVADFQYIIVGTARCERCLDDFTLRHQGEFTQQYFLFVAPADETDRPMRVLPDRTIEIAEPLRQEILLSLPIRLICKEECLGLCSECGANLNKEECRCPK